jgi:hypothetical protein
MKRRIVMLLLAFSLASVSACSKLKEVRSESKFGPRFNHRGTKRTDSTQWTVQQGVEFKFKDGFKTGITYRRRDVDDGNGNNDNSVFVDFSFPIWKAKKKPSANKKRIKKLEKRIAKLEAILTEEGEK